MFPNTNHQPATASELVVGVRVARDVRKNLLAPKLLIGFWPRCVLGAAMPEAAIYEDGNSGTSKNDIRSASRMLKRLSIDRVAKPHSMQ